MKNNLMSHFLHKRGEGGWIDFVEPKAAPQSREEQLLQLWKHGGMTKEFLSMDSSKNDLATVSKAIAKERNVDFSSAVDIALNEIPPLPLAGDFSKADFSLDTPEGRNNLAKAAKHLAHKENGSGQVIHDRL